MSRKKADFQQLLEYINKGKEQKNRPIFHNLKSDDDHIKMIAEEFEENAKYCPKRKNGVECYHEVLSLPKNISGKNIPEILDNLARKYLKIRAPEALAYAKAHLDTDNPHIHFCISGNKLKQRTKNRLSKSDFNQIKRRLEKYKSQNFPELGQTKTERKIPPTPFIKGETRKYRERGQTIKETLSRKISEIFLSASSLSESLQSLRQYGLEPYKRGKQAIYGVKYQKKKYRMSTLGVRELIDSQTKIWTQTKQRLSELDRIRESKDRGRKISKSLIK